MNAPISARLASIAFAVLMTLGTLASIHTLASIDAPAESAQMAQAGASAARS